MSKAMRKHWARGEKKSVADELGTRIQYLSYVLATGRCSQDFARRLAAVCRARGLDITAEEIMFRENSLSPLLEPSPYQKNKPE